MSDPAYADNNPRVVIAIVSTNDVHNVVGCLQSLTRSTYPSFRVVVCENGGVEAFERAAGALAEAPFLTRDPSPRPAAADTAWTQGHADFHLADGGQPVTLLRSTANLGYAGGVNACIAAVANTPWDAVWVLNPDTFPEPDALFSQRGRS